MKKSLMLAAAAMFGMATTFGSVTTASAQQFVTIGTGGVTGVYYPTGGAICRLVNKGKKEHGIRCSVESTGGSVYNLNAIAAGELDMGVAQSDWQFHAYNGTSKFEKQGANKDLRAVFSVHPEPVTVVARADSGIKNFDDLKGKRVNIGNPGSGQRGNALELFAMAGIDPENDLQTEGLKPSESASMLQDGRIDAFFYTVGHPNGSMKEAVAGARKVNFVAVPAEISSKLVEKFPFFAAANVPVKLYPGIANEADVPTFGVKATLCTSSDVSDDIVYAITKEVFDNFEEFKKLHPAYASLTKEQMLDGLSAPIHPGAMKYYKEAGLM